MPERHTERRAARSADEVKQTLEKAKKRKRFERALPVSLEDVVLQLNAGFVAIDDF